MSSKPIGPVLAENEMLIGGRILKVKKKAASSSSSSSSSSAAAQKTKNLKKQFQDLAEGRKALRQGRHLCDCDGNDHRVLTNCIHCGKIHCEQEGYGPCLSCGIEVTKPTDVLTKKQREEIGLVEALRRRDRLLEYDRQFAQRTTVIDDQIASLVFGGSENNYWLTEEEREESKKKEKRVNEILEKQENRSNRILKYRIDFAGRRIVEDDSQVISEQEEMKNLIQDLKVSQTAPSSSKELSQKQKKQQELDEYLKNVKTVIASSMVHPSVANSGMLKFVDKKQADDGKKKEKLTEEERMMKIKKEQQAMKRSIVQDEVSVDTDDHSNDLGYCMSMHQPWASLLVHGIKQHEGRQWNHHHRGRLWIASTVQEPTQEEIEELEQFYKAEPLNRTADTGYEYPQHYPTGVILGCVDVKDIVPQEDYSDRFPNDSEQESESDFVFICKNPRRLEVPFPISGQPKIYKLPRGDLMRCQSGLRE